MFLFGGDGEPSERPAHRDTESVGRALIEGEPPLQPATSAGGTESVSSVLSLALAHLLKNSALICCLRLLFFAFRTVICSNICHCPSSEERP